MKYNRTGVHNMTWSRIVKLVSEAVHQRDIDAFRDKLQAGDKVSYVVEKQDPETSNMYTVKMKLSIIQKTKHGVILEPIVGKAYPFLSYKEVYFNQRSGGAVVK